MTTVTKPKHRRSWLTQSRYRAVVFVMTYSSFMFACGLYIGVSSR